MINKLLLIILAAVSFSPCVNPQAPLKYQLPPDEIVRIVDAPAAPIVSVSPDKKSILVIERQPILSIWDLSAQELRLGGLRINPATNGPGRQIFNKGFSLMNIDGTNLRIVEGLPENPRLGYPIWSGDGKKLAFTVTTTSGIELWICEINTGVSARIAEQINTIFGNAISWLPDNQSLIYTIADPGRGIMPERSLVPEGPVIQENLGGEGQAPTYQDMLKDPADEAVFEYFARSQLMLWDGSSSVKLGKPAMITDVSPSPDGHYLLLTIINRPFSYIVPFYNFPSSKEIWDMEGDLVKVLSQKPLIENEPRGYDMVQPGPRLYQWRSDTPADVCWVEALDEGDFKKDMEYHDRLWILGSPFDGDPVELAATGLRFYSVTWGREDFALVSEGSARSRKRIVSSFNPQMPNVPKRKIHEYNSDDGYSDPGRFLTEINSSGKNVLMFTGRGKSLVLSGNGASPEGDRPFIDRYDISNGTTTRLWQSDIAVYESVSSVLDMSKGLILTSRQSVKEVPNYYIRNLKNNRLIRVTNFVNPYPQMAGVHKELVRYKRNDSLDLSFTLYLPEGYDKDRDGPLPTLLWAYPREYNDPKAAGQVSGSPYMFTRITPSSALVYVTQGYAILMDASFPIVGTDGKEPNDTFVEQLVANAEAAISKAVSMGVTDPLRVAVSGHSYGGFMTANLLSHSRLFAAGIAESGAYNRTLTPFGFQNEKRSYWEAPDVYNRMSPFMNADKVKDPILLIHGMADNNSGTFPIQSERYYAALKGFGATVRLVMLPNESHGYAARESILHKHWEVLNWLDRYIRENKK